MTVTDLHSASSFMYRENRVPYYQRLFQHHDGKRQWWKVSPNRRTRVLSCSMAQI